MSIRNTLSIFAAVFALAIGTAQAQATFAKLQNPQPTEGGGKIEVIEFFWYGCPHCYALEPSVNAWLKNAPKDVVFRRIPANPSEGWGEMARVYYTLEAMGLLEKYHQRVFDAMHKENVNLGNKRIREEWLAKNGIDPAKYNDVEKSFSVVTNLSRARQLTMAYQVDTVPRLIVNGRYYASENLTVDKVFPAVDQMIAQVRKEKS
jgi:thiol:disulfide interchange protein DsbA